MVPAAMNAVRLLQPLLLVLALLFVQQGAATHTIAHALAEQSQDQSLPHDQQCELCAGYAQIGSAVGCNAVHFDLIASCGSTYEHSRNDPYTLPHAAFAARAPPHTT
jgi:hypothetical protein